MMLPTTGEPVSARRMRRDDQMLYLMLKPDPKAAAVMAALRRQHGLAHKYAAERFHITLVPFGDIRTISPENLDRIRAAAASLQAEPFDVVVADVLMPEMEGAAVLTGAEPTVQLTVMSMSAP